MKLVFVEVMDDLCEEGMFFDEKFLVGMMVEVLLVVVMLDCFVCEVDFVSIGINDLV